MLSRQSNQYLQWALREFSSWQGVQHIVRTKLIHIHGTADKTLFYSLINPVDYTINGGSHICVLNCADQVGTIVRKELEKK